MITVAIVTRNRANLLRECLESLSLQRASSDWRVIVVDNGSDDDTFAVASTFAAADPRFGVVVEPQPGASRARNRAAHEAATPYLLFVDDECTFPDGYVERACALVREREPACFGGPVHARFAAQPPRPAWYKDVYGAFSLPENNPSGGPPRLSAGNLGAHREALLAVGGFPESFGPTGNRMVYGEENAVIAAMWRRYGSEAVIYDAGLINRHLVRPEKYRWATIFRESFSRGVARGRLKAHGFGEPDDASAPGPASHGRRGAVPRVLTVLCDAMLDLTLLRRITESGRYPDVRNVIYERWTRYVTMTGLLIGYLKGRREVAGGA